MARHAFYDSPEYRKKQSLRTKALIDAGKYNHLKKHVLRACARSECNVKFSALPSDMKRFCSSRCSGIINNQGRVLSEQTKLKISASLRGTVSPYRGVEKIPRVERICINDYCRKTFACKRYNPKKFCSTSCAATRPTSPKASRGKAGIRFDINDTIYFYSRWEANIARLYSFLGIAWEFTPKTFDIGGQRYTPDFYLPESNSYVEVKNFMNEYSKNRDRKFRKLYKNIQLTVILKDEYYALEKEYASRIPFWEYNSSPVSASRN